MALTELEVKKAKAAKSRQEHVSCVLKNSEKPVCAKRFRVFLSALIESCAEWGHKILCVPPDANNYAPKAVRL